MQESLVEWSVKTIGMRGGDTAPFLRLLWNFKIFEKNDKIEKIKCFECLDDTDIGVSPFFGDFDHFWLNFWYLTKNFSFLTQNWKIVKIQAYFWDLWYNWWKKIRKIWKIHEFYLNKENWSEYLLKTAFFAIFWPILAILVNFWPFLTNHRGACWTLRGPEAPLKIEILIKKIFHWSKWRFF